MTSAPIVPTHNRGAEYAIRTARNEHAGPNTNIKDMFANTKGMFAS